MIQNAAAHLVFSRPNESHVTQLLVELHRLPVAANIIFKFLLHAKLQSSLWFCSHRHVTSPSERHRLSCLFWEHKHALTWFNVLLSTRRYLIFISTEHFEFSNLNSLESSPLFWASVPFQTRSLPASAEGLLKSLYFFCQHYVKICMSTLIGSFLKLSCLPRALA